MTTQTDNKRLTIVLDALEQSGKMVELWEPAARHLVQLEQVIDEAFENSKSKDEKEHKAAMAVLRTAMPNHHRLLKSLSSEIGDIVDTRILDILEMDNEQSTKKRKR